MSSPSSDKSADTKRLEVRRIEKDCQSLKRVLLKVYEMLYMRIVVFWCPVELAYF